MELRELISFYYVARRRSVSKAAREMELGQPTVTSHIRKLEAEFGLVLFDRITRPIRLTSDGETFLQLATPIVEAVDALKTQMNYHDGRGSFTVGAGQDLVTNHLPEIVKDFRAQQPDVHIRIIVRPYTVLLDLLRSGELDLILSIQPSRDETALEFVELFRNKMTLIAPIGHPLLQRHSVQLEDIARWPLILSSPESSVRRKVEQALKGQGLSYDVVLEMDNTELIKRYVEVGLGLALSSDFASLTRDSEKIGVISLDHLFSDSIIGVSTLKGKFMPRSAKDFMDMLVDRLKGYRLP